MESHPFCIKSSIEQTEIITKWSTFWKRHFKLIFLNGNRAFGFNFTEAFSSGSNSQEVNIGYWFEESDDFIEAHIRPNSVKWFVLSKQTRSENMSNCLLPDNVG